MLNTCSFHDTIVVGCIWAKDVALRSACPSEYRILPDANVAACSCCKASREAQALLSLNTTPAGKGIRSKEFAFESRNKLALPTRDLAATSAPSLGSAV